MALVNIIISNGPITGDGRLNLRTHDAAYSAGQWEDTRSTIMGIFHSFYGGGGRRISLTSNTFQTPAWVLRVAGAGQEPMLTPALT